MAVSSKLRDMLRDATLGLTDAQVCERTGIGFATWRRMLQGHVPSDPVLVQFATGLELDATQYIEAAAEVRPSASPADIIRYGLEKSELTPSQRMDVMECYRQALERERHNEHAA